jgi:hypothetical protein
MAGCFRLRSLNNGSAIRQGPIDALSGPAAAEREAAPRALSLAEIVDTSIVIVHGSASCYVAVRSP